MATLAAAAGAAAAVIHVLIFVLESLAWKRPQVQRLFGAKTDEAAATLAPVMYNQGFYNLFLAAGALAGVALYTQNETAVLLGYTCGFMCAAALVLVGRAPAMWRGAVVQGVVPAVALVALAFA